MTRRIGVVGGGILGLAIGRQLALEDPSLQVTVLEKELELAAHQTAHNSGVVHAGVYYPEGSLKARLCRRGAELLREFTAARGLPYDQVGKLIVATNEEESTRLDAIERRARSNGVPDLRRVGGGEIASLEPAVSASDGLHSPHTAITDYRKVAAAYADDITMAGHEIHLGAEITSLELARGHVRLGTRDGRSFSCDHAIVCAGLGTNTMARLAGAASGPRIVPFRGEFYELRGRATGLVRGLVYPVPDPRYPFLGVHFTKRVDGSVLIGPNAVLAGAMEGYRRRDFELSTLLSYVASPEMWNLARKNWRAGLFELRGSLSRRAFLRRARHLVPDLRPSDVVRAPAGVRAQAVGRDGALVDDFVIDRPDRLTLVRNAPSPAATSSLAIAEHVVQQLSTY